MVRDSSADRYVRTVGSVHASTGASLECVQRVLTVEVSKCLSDRLICVVVVGTFSLHCMFCCFFSPPTPHTHFDRLPTLQECRCVYEQFPDMFSAARVFGILRHYKVVSVKLLSDDVLPTSVCLTCFELVLS